jgi:hypothetical protein
MRSSLREHRRNPRRRHPVNGRRNLRTPPHRSLKTLLREIFSEPEGDNTPSFARIFTAIWMAACITWISAYLAVTKKLPDGPTLFGMAAIGGFLYPANKIANAITGPNGDDQKYANRDK